MKLRIRNLSILFLSLGLLCLPASATVQRLADGFTLQYTDASGIVRAAGIYDPNYLNVLGVFQAQMQADHDNNAAVAGYTGALSNYQGWLNNGSLGAVQASPVKPLKTVVDDLGNVTHVPFTPPLPDPVLPVFVPSTGQIRATTTPPDRIDLLTIMLQSLMKDVAALKAKLGVQ